MTSEVFYRRWRPQNLSNVVGQEHVTQTLLNALKTGRISHAYLFCGPRGTGKTSTGRILAKAINCLAGNGTGEPCNECSMCLAITEGRCMDVIEIDAASNTGVDDIRSLKEKVSYSPGEARYKVYIVDEVHMLSNNASNALLKTLEEPPPQIIFILATTESHKLIPTILSRCQRFDFKRLSYIDIVKKLDDICQSEGLTIEPGALNLVARSATGSLRDAENLLEQIYIYYGNTSSKEQVQALLGNTGNEYARQLVSSIVSRDTARGLKLINEAEASGVDLKQFTREITLYLRGLLLVKSGCKEISDLTDEETSHLKSLASNINPDQLLKAIRLFAEVRIENYSTLPLELALVDTTLNCQTHTSGTPATAKQKPAEASSDKTPQKTAGTGSDSLEQTGPSPANTPALPAEKEKASVAETPEKKAPMANETQPASKASSKETAPVDALETYSEYELLLRNWNQMLELAPDALKRNPSFEVSPPALRLVSALMRNSVRLVSFGNDTLVLAFKFKIHKEKMENSNNKRTACQIVSTYIGRPVTIKCIHEPEKNHLVRAAQEQLGARIISVEEK